VARYIFQDLDEFADCLPGVEGQFIPTARQTAEWWIESAPVGCTPLHSSQSQMGGSATFAGEGNRGVFTVLLPATDPRQIRVDGQFLEPDAFILLGEEQCLTFTSADVVRWAGAHVPMNTTLIASELLPTASRHGPHLRSSLPYLDRLRWVISRVSAGGSDIDINHPAAAAAAAQEVAICLNQVLERRTNVRRLDIRPQLSRGRVIARTLSLIEANEGQPLFIEDLCLATGVSERSLRNIFHEFFGVGPMRLLKVRQLREIRAALLRADPQRDTITRIAAGFGIWDFSLFARNYKAMFGESPSRTLRTPPTAARVRSSLSWLHYASRIFLDDAAPTPRPRELVEKDSIARKRPSNVRKIV
jgi:AraC family transcriptional regulator, ethanolamine operon transcriptional activator